MYECVTCGRPVRGAKRFLCRSCIWHFGNKSEWSAWLSDIVREEDRKRQKDLYWHRAGVAILSYDDEKQPGDYPKPAVALHTRSDSFDGLPYSPYPTEQENRIYRKANGLPMSL